MVSFTQAVIDKAFGHDHNTSRKGGTMIHSSKRAEYLASGYYLARGIVPEQELQKIEDRCLAILSAFTKRDFLSLQDPDLISLLSSDRSVEQHLYSEIRIYPELRNFSKIREVCGVIEELLGRKDIVLLEKIPFRIDCPMVLRELAVWHQDYYYVRGSENTVTAWVPLFDVGFKEGCLLIMPGSHKDGVIAHDTPVLGKKHYPSSIFDKNVRYVEMKRGDALFFDARLLHSSGNNIGDAIRFSVQARYQEADVESDKNMGERILINEIA